VLVFTRKRDEAVVIGDGVEVRVLRIGRDSIRLGVTAPTSVPVHRLEIYEQIRAENQMAAAVLRSPDRLSQLRKHTIKDSAPAAAGEPAQQNGQQPQQPGKDSTKPSSAKEPVDHA
jgi:carbon storage regulator